VYAGNGGGNSTTPSGLSSVSYGGDQAKSWVSDFFADMYHLRGYIFGFGIGIALFLSFFYLYFLRIPGVLSIMVWTIVLGTATSPLRPSSPPLTSASLGIFFLLLIGSILLYSLSVKWSNSDTRSKGEVTTMQALSIIGFILTALYTCLICVLRKRILLAIGIVKEAARALASMPVIIFMPVFQCIAIVLFLVPWVIYSLYLASSGTIKVHEVESGGVTTQYRTMEYSSNQRYAFLYLLFCWYWTSEFILACGQIISAMSISAWYFTRDKKTEGNGTVLWVSDPSPSVSCPLTHCSLSLPVPSCDDLQPSGHRRLRVAHLSDHQNDPRRHRLPPEEGEEVWQPRRTVCAGLSAVLHVVS
jgi:hypothetical protein